MAGPWSAGRPAGWQHNQFSELVRQERESEEGVIAKTTAASFAFASAAAAAVSSGLQCIITVHSPSERRESGERESGRGGEGRAKYETPLLSRHAAPLA